MHTLLHCHTTPTKMALKMLDDELAQLHADHYCYINSSRILPFMRLRNQVLATLIAYHVFLKESCAEERKWLITAQPLFALLGNLDAKFTRYANGNADMPWNDVLCVINQVLAQPPALPIMEQYDDSDEHEYSHQQP